MIIRTAIRAARLLRQVILPRPFPGVGRYLYRLLVLGLFLPLLLALQLLHWLGFLIDEIVFFRYRQVAVREPLFVLGVPRSGTTFLHRLLARDPSFTTFSTWECFFAPSIAERYLLRGIGRLDRLVGRPLGRIIGLIESRALGWLDDVHPIRLEDPEEDYFAFLPVLCCFILVVPFPEADWIWRMGRFDRDVDAREREALMNWYRKCLQKHLYVHGADRRLLSKNASFAGMSMSLTEAFPDCRVVICERDALQVVASQFNALTGGMRFFGLSPSDPRFRARLLDCIAFYYENLERLRERLPQERCVDVPLWALSRETRRVLETITERFDLPFAPEVEAEVDAYEKRPSKKSPGAGPELSLWDIDRAELTQRFAAWRHEETMRL